MRNSLKYRVLWCWMWHLWQQKCKNSWDVRVRVRARGGDCRFFYSSRNSVFDGWLIDSFFYIRLLFENNTLFSPKRHVIFTKTTRCFLQNDTSFSPKRYVVFLKTTRCFHQNDTLFSPKWYVVFTKTSRRFIIIDPSFVAKRQVDWWA